MGLTEFQAILLIAAGVFGFIEAKISWGCIGLVGFLQLIPFLR